MMLCGRPGSFGGTRVRLVACHARGRLQMDECYATTVGDSGYTYGVRVEFSHVGAMVPRDKASFLLVV